MSMNNGRNREPSADGFRAGPARRRGGAIRARLAGCLVLVLAGAGFAVAGEQTPAPPSAGLALPPPGSAPPSPGSAPPPAGESLAGTQPPMAGFGRRCARAGVAACVVVPEGDDFNDDLVALGADALRARLAPLFRFAGGREEPSEGQALRERGESPWTPSSI